jgi:hypothetical protein
MPEVLFGPPLGFDWETMEITMLPGIMVDAATIGEAFDAYEKATGAFVVPHDPPKYFRYFKSRDASDCVLVDVHVLRGELEICIKQDLNFLLRPDDKIEIGCLGC